MEVGIVISHWQRRRLKRCWGPDAPSHTARSCPPWHESQPPSFWRSLSAAPAAPAAAYLFIFCSIFLNEKICFTGHRILSVLFFISLCLGQCQTPKKEGREERWEQMRGREGGEGGMDEFCFCFSTSIFDYKIRSWWWTQMCAAFIFHKMLLHSLNPSQ